MDQKDNNKNEFIDEELDLQALLDKYLPEEEKQNAVSNGSDANTNAPSNQKRSNAKAINNDFYLENTEEPGEPAADFDSFLFLDDESEEVNFAETEEIYDDISEEISAQYFDSEDDAEDVSLFEEAAATEEYVPEITEEASVKEDGAVVYDGYDGGASDVTADNEAIYESEDGEPQLFVTQDDEEFIIDEDLIAELMAEDAAQFGGIEGFEDIEELSGFSVTGETEAVKEEIPVQPEPTPEPKAYSDKAPDKYGEITNEDEYDEFVHASLDNLESGATTETDINLLVAFGLEDELKKQVGEKKVSRMTRTFDEKVEAHEEKERKSVHNEYKDPSQTAEISGKYKKEYIAMKFKLGASILFALLLLVFENLPVIGYQFASFLDPAVYPVVYVMVDLQLLLLCLAPAVDQIFFGFAKLFKGKPVPESMLSIASLLSIVYSVMIAKTATPPTEPVMFNLPVAFCSVMTLIYAYLTIKREIFSFNVISSKKPKFALRRLSSKDATMEVAAFGNEGEEMGDVLKIEKTSFIDGYFYRTESANKSNSTIIFMCLILTLALAALLGGYMGMMNNTVTDCISFGYTAFVAAVPLTVLFSYSYPFYKANLDSYENDSTIVGENSLEEYSGASVISFDDKLVFPSVGVKVQNIKIYNNYRFDRVLYYAASVFAKTGGPLADIFELATMEMGYSEDVLLTGIGDGFIQTEVNGKSIIFGRAYDLETLGIEIPDEIKYDDDDFDSDVSVMYMVFKGKPVAKMNILYSLDSDFEYIVKQLAGSGMSVCVKTLDPNIDEEMIKQRVKIDKYPMRVIRYASLDEVASETERSDSGIVARGSAGSLLRTVTYCDKVLEVKRTTSFIGLLATIITVIILAVVLLTGNMVHVRSVFALVNHLFWLIPMAITAKALVR